MGIVPIIKHYRACFLYLNVIGIIKGGFRVFLRCILEVTQAGRPAGAPARIQIRWHFLDGLKAF